MAVCLTQESFFVAFQEFDGIQFNCRLCPVGTQYTYTLFVKYTLIQYTNTLFVKDTVSFFSPLCIW